MSEELNLKQLKTAGFDSNFPNMNQTKRCYQNYINYYKCINIHSDNFILCRDFWSTYQSLCPNEWKQQWDTQREEGKFPGTLE